MQSEIIQIDHLAVPYFVRQSSRAKRLQLSVRQQRIELIIPPGVKSPVVFAFLQSSRQWMKQQYLNLTQHATLFWPEKFLPGEQICLEGEKRTLQIKYSHRLSVWHEAQCLVVEMPWLTQLNKFEPCLKMAVLNYFKQYAQLKIEKKLPLICNQLGRWPKSIKIKTQSSRWGSCGIHNEIYINWLLILAPSFVLDYVILHECCHLFYRSHGVRFWQKVTGVMPDYKLAERWLKQNGRYMSLNC